LGREISHSPCDTRHVRLKTRTECNTEKIRARKVGIDQQSVPLKLELVTVRAEVRHAHSVPWHCASVLCNQVSIRIQPSAEDLSGQSEEKKKRAFQSFAADSTEALYRGQLQVCLTKFRVPAFND
jgi:hypothetical protein